MKKDLIIFILISLLIPVACNELDNPIESQLFSTTPLLSATKEVTAISQNNAVSGGSIVSAKGKNIASRGVCWDTTKTPTIKQNNVTYDGTTSGEFTSNISGLEANTTYYVRSYLTVGESGHFEIYYGSEVSFKTLEIPNIPPIAPSSPTPSNTSVNQEISVSLSWSCSDPDGDVLSYDVYFGTSSNPTALLAINQSEQNFLKSGLTYLTTYYWKVVAKDNKGGITSSPVWSFTTVEEIITDIDGNNYHSIKIGTQVWMVENLKTTKYRNGDLIPNVADGNAWSNLTTGAYCNYDNNENNAATYGRLYNWYAVNDSRKIAPIGWHVATDAEWTTLINFVGANAGTKLKSKTGWNSDGNGTDDYGFTALATGSRNYDGAFHNIGDNGYWWSSKEYDTINAWLRYMYYFNNSVERASTSKKDGFSVRCVKD